MKPIVSIIVPIFNVERYLPRCIDSLINQSLRDIEIILVNDGSTDKSGDICENYAKMDTRIKVIHKKNGGLSDARNAGLEIVNGDFIGFVDSDDFVHKDMYSILYKSLLKYNCDIVESGFEKVFENVQIIDDLSIDDRATIYSKKEAVISAFMDHHCRNYVWNKLYKRELWRKIRFPYGKIFEDVFTTYKVFNISSKIVKLDKILYYYLQRENSIVRSDFSTKTLDHCEALEVMMQFIVKTFPETAPITCIKYYHSNLYYLQQLISNRNEIPNSKIYINQLRKQLLNPEYTKYLNGNKNIKKLCNEILFKNYDEYLIERKKFKFKLLLLKQSIWSFYGFQLFIQLIKKVIQRKH